jgi:hypothetical protein
VLAVAFAEGTSCHVALPARPQASPDRVAPQATGVADVVRFRAIWGGDYGADWPSNP